MPDHPFCEEYFPNIQMKPPLMQLEAISPYPVSYSLGAEPNAHLSAPTVFNIFSLSQLWQSHKG